MVSNEFSLKKKKFFLDFLYKKKNKKKLESITEKASNISINNGK